MPHSAKKHCSEEGCTPCVAFTREAAGNQPRELGVQRDVSLNGVVKLIVGGTPYMTTYRTLVSHEGSRLAVYFRQLFAQASRDLHGTLLNDNFVNITEDYNVIYPVIFIDRDGSRFAHILNYLRDGDVAIPDDIMLRRALLQDARYFGLTALESSLKLMSNTGFYGMQTPRTSQKHDTDPNGFSSMTLDCAPRLHERHQIISHTNVDAEGKRYGSMGSLPSTSVMGNTLEDTQSYVFSHRSYEDDLASSQKSLLHVMESDNIEDAGIFVQTTPVSRLGKTEFSTTFDF